MKWSVVSNRLFKTFIGCAIIFIVLSINMIVREVIKENKEIKQMCQDYKSVNSAGRPGVCK